MPRREIRRFHSQIVRASQAKAWTQTAFKATAPSSRFPGLTLALWLNIRQAVAKRTVVLVIPDQHDTVRVEMHGDLRANLMRLVDVGIGGEDLRLRRHGRHHVLHVIAEIGRLGDPALDAAPSGVPRRQPHGVDLGPLQPSLPQRLRTPGKRIALLPRAIAEELQRVRADLLTPPAPGELVLIGRRELRSNNSWMHNHERLVKGPVRCVLLMHPEDAAARALVPGQRVSVSSRVGEVLTEVRISDEVAPGAPDVVLAGLALPADTPEQTRRVKLAEWLTSPNNPLPARVMVNRLWQHHFGHGIVDTPGDFGAMGTRPTPLSTWEMKV